MNSKSDLKGKTALVTGAGRGIGRASAIGLALQGANVVVLARSKDELDKTAGMIRDVGGDAVVVVADVGEPREVVGAARRVTDDVGRVDVLVNNAAVVWPISPSVLLDPFEWASAIAVNLTGAVQLTLAVLP